MDPLVSKIVRWELEQAFHHLDCLNVLSKEHILVPVNNSKPGEAGGSHWSLLYLHAPTAAFTYVDSFEDLTLNEEHGRRLAANLSGYFGFTGYDFHIFDSVKQQNSNDCGLYVIAYTHNFLTESVITNSNLGKSIQFTLRCLKELQQPPLFVTIGKIDCYYRWNYNNIFFAS